MIVPDEGSGDALRYFVNHAQPEDLVLKLYRNDVTPTETNTADDFVEAAFPGYAPKTLSGSAWAIVDGSPSRADYQPQAFVVSDPIPLQEVFGWFMVRATSGRIAAAERFAAGPARAQRKGDSIVVSPSVKARADPVL